MSRRIALVPVPEEERLVEVTVKVRVSKRDIQVMQAVADMKTNKELAADMRISESGVKWHIKSLCKRLGLQVSRTGLAVYALRGGLIK